MKTNCTPTGFSAKKDYFSDGKFTKSELVLYLFFAFFVLLFLFASCASVPPVYKVENQSDLKGIYYCLPKNKIQIQVTVTNTTYQGGALYQNYIYLIPEVIDTTFKYKIAGIKINNLSVADQSQWYCAVFDKNFGKDVTISFERTPDGCLKNVNTQAEDNTVEKTAAGFSIIANVGNNVGADTSRYQAGKQAAEAENLDMLQFNFNEKNLYNISADKKGAENVNNKKQTLTKTFKPSPEQAQELVREYERIRAEKLKLITGQQSNITDLQLYNEIIFQLEQRQNEIIESFYGKAITTKKIVSFETDTCNVDTVLFYYHPDKGLLFPNKDKPAFKICTIDSTYVPFRVKIRKNNFDLKIKYSNDDKTPKNRGSFYYRVPGEIKTTVSMGEATLRDTTLLMAQAGTIARLPIRAGFLRTRYDIVFDPVTGAMTKLSVNETALDKIRTEGF
ncbi:MAG: DUF4831 family protein [Bacteroidia bacterium]|jgi:hypothetical protein|nr:DUF4831 family protein [Bacteroidia bacterium]